MVAHIASVPIVTFRGTVISKDGAGSLGMPRAFFTGWFGLVPLESRTSARGLPVPRALGTWYTLGSSLQLALQVLFVLITRENFAKIYLMSQYIR